VRVVLAAALLTFATGVSNAAAYPWPIRPFHVQHAIRGNFDDPRALRGAIDAPGYNPLSFHSGVDIQAPDGTPVYAIKAGQVTLNDATAISVASPFAFSAAPVVFGYWHIDPVVTPLQRVARGQLLGYVTSGAGHLHLSEKRHGQYLNPLRRGGLTPYDDWVPPVIRALVVYRCGSPVEIELDAVNGCVDLAVDAYDLPPIAPAAPWTDVVLSPTRITWSGLFQGGWQPLAFHAETVNFTRLLFRPLDDVYAPGTRQNRPDMPGDYRYWLGRNLDTGLLDNGPHTISVTAEDVRDNSTTALLTFTVTNTP
jgi:murein DD-endopeptidase MepM/ murein hydrolase activator NlpD